MITPESLAQIEKKYKVGATPTTSTPTQSSGSLRDRVIAAASKKKEEVKWKDKGVIGNLMQDVKETGSAIADSLKKRVANVSSAYKANQAGEQTAPETGFQYATNVLGAGLDVLGNVAMGAGKAVLPEVAEKAISKGTQAVVNTDTVQKLIKGYEEMSPRAQRNVQGAFDIASVIPAGKATQLAVRGAEAVAPGAVKAVKTVAQVPIDVAKTTGRGALTGLSKVTGMEPQTIKNVFNEPEVYSKKNIAETNREDFADTVKMDIDKRIEDLSETGKEYNTIRNAPETVDVSRDVPVNFLKDKFKLGTDENGRIVRTSNSTAILSKADEAKLNDYIDRFFSGNKLTNNEYLNARRELDGIAKFEGLGKSTELENVAKLLRRKLDDTYGTKIKGLKELDERFAPEAKLLREVRKELLDKEGNLSQMAITKISNILQSNRRDLREALERIRPGISKEVNILRTMEDYTRASGNKIGTYGSAALTGGAIATGGAWLIPAILAYPPIAIQLIRGLGMAKKFSANIIESVVSKMSKGEKLNKVESQVVEEALKTEKPSRKVRETIAKEAPEVATKYFSSERTSSNVMDSVMKESPSNAPESILSPIQVRDTANVASGADNATDGQISRQGGALESILDDKMPENADVDTMLEYAPSAKQEIDDFAQKIADRYKVKVAKAPIKSRERALDKVDREYKGDQKQLRDLVRNTIIADKDQISRLIGTLKKKGGARIVNFKEQTPDKFNGYSGFILNYRTENGLVGEIQVNTPKMIYAKEKDAKKILGDTTYNQIKKEIGIDSGKGHEFYEKIRALNRSGRRNKEGKKLVKDSFEYYSKFNE